MLTVLHTTPSSILVKLPSDQVFFSQSARDTPRVREIVEAVRSAGMSSYPNAKEGPFTNVMKAEIVERNMRKVDYLTAFQLSDIYSDNVEFVQTMVYYLDLRNQMLQRIADEKVFREELAVSTFQRQSLFYYIQARALLDLNLSTQASRSVTRH